MSRKVRPLVMGGIYPIAGKIKNFGQRGEVAGAGTPRSLAWNRRRFTWRDEQSMLSYVRMHNVIYHVVTLASPHYGQLNIIAIMRIAHGKPLICRHIVSQTG